MMLNVFSADGKRRVFYAFQTLVMFAISLLALYGLKVMFTHTIEESFVLFIIGTILSIGVLIGIAIPVVIASIMLFFATLIGTFKGDEKRANALSLIVTIISVTATIIVAYLILT